MLIPSNNAVYALSDGSLWRNDEGIGIGLDSKQFRGESKIIILKNRKTNLVLQQKLTNQVDVIIY